MRKKMQLFKYRIQQLYNTQRNISYSYTLTTIATYLILIIYKFQPSMLTLNTIFSPDIATISGIILGFLFTTIGVISATNNDIITRLKTTGNINVVYTVYFNSIVSFVLTILLYLYKSFYVAEKDWYINIGPINKVALFFVFHVGLLAFINGFVLFLVSLRFFRKILITKKNNKA